MYGELAEWWPLLSRPEDYAEEAAFYRRALAAACERPPETLLELGSGGGNNASYLKAWFEMTLVDLSPDMLAVSRALNPELEHIEGDMRTVRLGRRYDCVLIHDAIVYMTSEADLVRAFETAFAHCRPGGALLVAPDHVRDTFRPSTGHGGHDGPERGLRYLSWTWDPDPGDMRHTVDYALMLRQADGSVRVVHDRHEEGLFARAQWLDALARAGFEPESALFDHSEVPDELEVFIGRRPM